MMTQRDRCENLADGLRYGFREARWSVYYLLYGLPLCLALSGIASLVQHRFSDPPTLLVGIAGSIGALFGFLLAALKTGPGNRANELVWRLLSPLFEAFLMWRLIRRIRRAEQDGSAAQSYAVGLRFTGRALMAVAELASEETSPTVEGFASDLTIGKVKMHSERRPASV